MLAICATHKPLVFKAPKTSLKAESVSQGTKLGDQTGHKKPLPSSKQPFVSSKEATKGRMHKEDHQETDGPTSLGVTSKARANLQLSSDQTKFVSEGLETILTQPIIGKGASSVFKDLDSPEDDLVIVVNESDKDEDDEVHATKNIKTKDTSVPKSLSSSSSQVQELTNQVLILQCQKYKLELEKNKAEAALLKAQPSFPNESIADDILLKVKLEDLSDILKDKRYAFFTSDSPPDEPIIVSDESEEEEEVAKDKDTEATSHDVPKDTLVPPPPSLKSA
uniref:Uncharacterized protein n=1 Tax=Tanacetum cinerariifolium TaxID=118510 RepID=A0A6L2KUL6_TANCI|nr:hypothetical protein [Tanacetum cinerariifolium]